MTAAAAGVVLRVAACRQGIAFVAREGSHWLEATRQKNSHFETPASALRCCFAWRSRVTGLARAYHRSLTLAPSITSLTEDERRGTH